MNTSHRKISYSAAEAARHLGMSKGVVLSWIRNGKLPARRRGRQYLVYHEDLEHLLRDSLANLRESKPEKKKSIRDYVGVLDGPGDLNTNPKYMDDFGK